MLYQTLGSGDLTWNLQSASGNGYQIAVFGNLILIQETELGDAIPKGIFHLGRRGLRPSNHHLEGRRPLYPRKYSASQS